MLTGMVYDEKAIPHDHLLAVRFLGPPPEDIDSYDTYDEDLVCVYPGDDVKALIKSHIIIPAELLDTREKGVFPCFAVAKLPASRPSIVTDLIRDNALDKLIDCTTAIISNVLEDKVGQIVYTKGAVESRRFPGGITVVFGHAGIPLEVLNSVEVPPLPDNLSHYRQLAKYPENVVRIVDAGLSARVCDILVEDGDITAAIYGPMLCPRLWPALIKIAEEIKKVIAEGALSVTLDGVLDIVSANSRAKVFEIRRQQATYQREVDTTLDRLFHLYNEIETAKFTARAIEKGISTIDKERVLDEINGLPHRIAEIAESHFDSAIGGVSFTTHPLTAQGDLGEYYLGRINVKMNLQSHKVIFNNLDMSFCGCRMEELLDELECWDSSEHTQPYDFQGALHTEVVSFCTSEHDGGKAAPHISSGTACFGNAGPSLVALLPALKITDAALIIIEFLQSVNEDDGWGRYAMFWPNSKEEYEHGKPKQQLEEPDEPEEPEEPEEPGACGV